MNNALFLYNGLTNKNNNMSLTKKSKEILEHLIENEFEKIDLEFDYIYKKSEGLINLCDEVSLTELSKKLTEKINVEL